MVQRATRRAERVQWARLRVGALCTAWPVAALALVVVVAAPVVAAPVLAAPVLAAPPAKGAVKVKKPAPKTTTATADDEREAEMFGGSDDDGPASGTGPGTGPGAGPGTGSGTATRDPAGEATGKGKKTAPASARASAGTPKQRPGGKDYGDTRWADASVTVADTDRLKDKLDIGGLLYLRNNAMLTDDTMWSRQRLSSSNLMDIYFDSRPNDRVRAFIRGRLLYSPIISDQQSASLTGLSPVNSQYQTQLVEMWVKFDIARIVYLTIGTQQMRWGTTRLWNPVDVIYATRRNPLTLFDQRTGMPMVKLHFPIDSLGWNGYLLALGERGDNLRNWGVAGRLEMVLSTVEVGLTAMKRMDFDPRVGLDWSAGIWDVDVTGELGLRRDAKGDVHWMLSAGVSYTLQIGEDDSIIFGAEYFHNPEGYDSGAKAAKVLTDWSIQASTNPTTAGPMPLTFFYTGKNYASLFAVAMGPGSWDDTMFTLSAISNLSDRTGMLQLVVSTKVFQDLRVEGFLMANLGGDGEFRFYSGYINDAMDAAKAQLGGTLPAALEAARPSRPIGQLGLNLRMSY